jgi:hypothetical protein
MLDVLQSHMSIGENPMSKLQLLRWMRANGYPAVECWRLWVEIERP